jgi:hypothetical protein
MMNYEKPTGVGFTSFNRKSILQKQQFTFCLHNICMLRYLLVVDIDAVTGEVSPTMPPSNTFTASAMESNLMQVLRQTKVQFQQLVVANAYRYTKSNR